MIVYVETNFLLELTYLQERCESCRDDELSAVDCRVLVNFTDALAFITNALRPSGE